jgi:L-cysteine/cystine lyase
LPDLRHTAYLNAGTFGPLAQATMDAWGAGAAQELEQGRGGAPYYTGVKETRARVRGQIAELIGVDPSHVALVYSTTSACQIALAGLGLTPDDEIVTTDEEHFGYSGLCTRRASAFASRRRREDGRRRDGGDTG